MDRLQNIYRSGRKKKIKIKRDEFEVSDVVNEQKIILIANLMNSACDHIAVYS